MCWNDETFRLRGGIEGELQLFTGEEHRKAGQIHQASSVIQVDVGENHPADFGGIASDEAHEFGERHFRIERTCQILELEAQKERVTGDFVIEVHGVTGVDEEIAGGMLDED